MRVLEAPNVEGRERGRDEACCADARECANELNRMNPNGRNRVAGASTRLRAWFFAGGGCFRLWTRLKYMGIYVCIMRRCTHSRVFGRSVAASSPSAPLGGVSRMASAVLFHRLYVVFRTVFQTSLRFASPARATACGRPRASAGRRETVDTARRARDAIASGRRTRSLRATTTTTTRCR